MSAESKNGGIFNILRTAKFYCRSMVKMESIHSEGVPFGALNLPDIKNLKWGNPKPKQFLGFQKLISSILSHVEIFAEFCGIFRIRAKMERYRMKIVFVAWPSLIDAHLVDNVTNTTQTVGRHRL